MLRLFAALATFLALVFATSVANSGPNRWTLMPLYGGEAWEVVVTPDDPDHYFVTTNQAGLFESTDGGLNWARVESLTQDYVRGLLIQPSETRGSNPQRIFVGALTSRRIHRSTDNGTSWTPSTTMLPFGTIEEITYHPANRDILYAVHSSAGIFKSIDGGDTWSAMNTGITSTFCTSISSDFSASNTFFASCSALYKTIDGGANWFQVVAPGLPINSLMVVRYSPSVAGTLFVTTTNGVYRSIDDGLSWTNTASGALLPDFDFWELVFDPADSNTVYVGASAGPWRSVDTGTTWIAANNGHIGSISVGIAIHPAQPNRLVTASLSGLNRSTDNGSNWQLSQTGFNNLIPQDIAFTPGNANRLFAATTSGLFRSLDGGASWEYLRSELDGASVHNVLVDSGNDQHLIATGSSRLMESTDGGDSWTNITGMSSGYPFATAYDLAPAPATLSRIYASVGGTSGAYVSTDGGATWTPPGVSPNDFTSLVVDPLDSDRVFGGWNGSVHVSTNGGMNWASVSTGLSGFIVGLQINPTNNMEMIAASTSSGVFRTTNGGGNWTAINNGIGVPSVDDVLIDQTTNTRFYAAAFDGVYVSEDSGANWAPSGTALNGLEASLIRQNPGDGNRYYAGVGANGFYELTRVPPGLTVNPQMLNVAEGSSTSFNITLDADATDPVMIDLSTSNAECSVSPPQLVLNVQEDPGLVTVSGTPDQVIDGTQSCSVISAAAVSDDPAYDTLNPEDVSVMVSDSDVADVQVLGNQPIIVMEPDLSAQFTVRLTSIPTSNVSMPIASNNLTEGTVSPGNLVITPGQALAGVPVTVTSVDDGDIDGDIPFTIIIGLTSSGDGNYMGIDPPDVMAINLDDDYIIFNDSLEN